MPFSLSLTARQRGANGVVQPLQSVQGKLRLLADNTLIVEFPTLQFSTADSSGFVNATGLGLANAVASGVVNKWRILDNSNNEVMSGDGGQRHKILSENRSQSWVTISGNHTSTFTSRARATLHNRNNLNHNVYLRLAPVASEYNSANDTTRIYFYENLADSAYSSFVWTHVHIGELGLDNANIVEDQVVQVNNLRFAIL